MKTRKKRSFALILTALLSLALFVETAFASTAFSGDEDDTLSAFAEAYGWDTEDMNAYEWTGINGETYVRRSRYEFDYYKDMFTTSEALAVDFGLITKFDLHSSGNASSVVQAAIAEWEEGNGELIDSLGRGTDNCKYNTWFYGYEVNNVDANGDGRFGYEDMEMRLGTYFPWCCVFVSYIADLCGLIDAGIFTNTASVPVEHSFFLSKGYDHFSIKDCRSFGGIYDPLPGDVLIWGEDDHIGFIVAVNDDSIETIEGNVNHTVAHMTYRKEDLVGNLGLAEVFHPDYPDNESTIFYFLVTKMGLTKAAACGILASIFLESGFDPESYGDYSSLGEPTSYGIVQWHAGRWEALKAFCEAQSLDWHTLDGQLLYLQHELETSYTGVLNDLLAIPESQEGAYDAGFLWTHDFEVCQGYEFTASDYRGRIARDTYYPKYKDFDMGKDYSTDEEN